MQVSGFQATTSTPPPPVSRSTWPSAVGVTPTSFPHWGWGIPGFAAQPLKICASLSRADKPLPAAYRGDIAEPLNMSG